MKHERGTKRQTFEEEEEDKIIIHYVHVQHK